MLLHSVSRRSFCSISHAAVLADDPTATTQTGRCVPTKWCDAPFPQWGHNIPERAVA